MNSGGSGTQAVVAANFNKDGKTDLAVANRVSQTVAILTGHGDGTFAAPVLMEMNQPFTLSPPAISMAMVSPT